ncbi:hypothetical protein [Hyphobacterium sp.]|uniref:hypothetical protein n=1 Tax=Hyphobacterium sp. TaxID=2004662 RepID=UPI003749D220
MIKNWLDNQRDKALFVSMTRRGTVLPEERANSVDVTIFKTEQYRLLWRIYYFASTVKDGSDLDFQRESKELYSVIPENVKGDSNVSYLQYFWIAFLSGLKNPPAWLEANTVEVMWVHIFVSRAIKNTFMLGPLPDDS